MGIIFTIGHRESYLRYFDEQPPHGPQKMGQTDEYQGGSVFQTKEAADSYLQSQGLLDYAVFGVVADWNKDTEPNESEPFHNLLVDSLLVKVD